MLRCAFSTLLSRLRQGPTACLFAPASARRRALRSPPKALSPPPKLTQTLPKDTLTLRATPSFAIPTAAEANRAAGRTEKSRRGGAEASNGLIPPPIAEATDLAERIEAVAPAMSAKSGVRSARKGEETIETAVARGRAQSLLHARLLDRNGQKSVNDALPNRANAAALLFPAEDVAPGVSDPGEAAASALLNPFRGLHTHIARSYRLEQFAADNTPADVLLAKQEKKSAAFSFLRFKVSSELYHGHWGAAAELQEQFDTICSPNASGERMRHTLFNNDLGIHSPRIAVSYPLVIAQRLLLFPDTMRHWHALCGRDGVPCDFYADIDLPGETPEGGERLLLEMLNYLEVRLPGIGFTDPFFLVLANASSLEEDARLGAGKVSFHLHARSMSYQAGYLALGAQELSLLTNDSSGGKNSGKCSMPRQRRRPKASGANAVDASASNAAESHNAASSADEATNDDDDLSDLVNVVVGGDGAGPKRSAGGRKIVPKVIAFEDHRVVRLLADEVNQMLGKTVIDDNCYRPNGMLRCAFSAKLSAASQEQPTSRAGRGLVPLTTAREPVLQARLNTMVTQLRRMTDPEILELSFCNRFLNNSDDARLVQQHLKERLPQFSARQRRMAVALASGKLAPTEAVDRGVVDWLYAGATATRHQFKLLRPRHILGPCGDQRQEYDQHGNLVSPFLTEAAKWRRYRHVVAKLRNLPPHAADSFDTWVRVGLALHNFSNEDHVFDEWVRFSIKCPQKFSREACRRKWVQFERNPDALNWRRGFNYLNSTIWKQV